MTLPRPKLAPDHIPLWAWRLKAWIDGGRQGPRPRHAPERLPPWFHLWRLWRLARHTRKGSKQWKRYLDELKKQPDPEAAAKAVRTAIVNWARYGIAHNAEIHYSEGSQRDDFLHEPRGHLPMTTDCSGFVTQCHWAAGAPDPSSLGYRYVGWTGTLLSAAYAHGIVTTNLAAAKPGDAIVIGPGSGWHAVICLEPGADPIVGSHGSEPGPLSEHSSYDPRAPKRVCQILP